MPKRTQLTEAEREQRRAADRVFVQQAVEQLRSSAGWQRWLTTRRHFHSYSLRNQLLIAMQMPDATRVAGFKAWLALGYCVRRGEKALRIFAPCTPSKAKLQAWRDAGADPAEKPRTFFRLTAVFDRSQVDELPPPAEPAPLDPPAATEIDGNELAPWLEPLIALRAHHIEGVVATELPGYERHIYAATYGEPPDPPATVALLAALAEAATTATSSAVTSSGQCLPPAGRVPLLLDPEPTICRSDGTGHGPTRSGTPEPHARHRRAGRHPLLGRRSRRIPQAEPPSAPPTP